MNKTVFLVVLLLCALSGTCGSPAFGGDISLSITTSITVDRNANSPDGNRANVKVAITNKGDETASNLSLQARLSGLTRTVAVAGQAAPGKTVDVAFTMPVPATLNGSYPVPITVSYAHPNGQAEAVVLIAALQTTDGGHGSPLAMKLELRQRGGADFLAASVSTNDPALKEITLTCHLPAGLTVEQNQRRLRLDNGTAATTFDLAAARGVQGRYAVYVVAEADVNGRHEMAATAIAVPIAPQNHDVSPCAVM